MKTRNTRTAFAALAAILGLGGLSVHAQELIHYPSFSSSAGLNLVSAAETDGGVLRLTPAAANQAGAAWFHEKQHVAGGFVSEFGLLITDSGNTGADGIAFVLQNDAEVALGSSGQGIGYAGIQNSVVVEFDTWQNANDPNGNHLAVVVNGNTIGVQENIPTLEDGEPHFARVQYVPGTLTVYLDDVTTPALVVPVDIGSFLDAADGRAWVGFTASTGSAFANQQILHWHMSGFSGGTPPGADYQFIYQLPSGLSLFSSALVPVTLTNGTVLIDDLPQRALRASDLIALGSTIVVALEGGDFRAAVGREGVLLFGEDFLLAPGRGYVINLPTSAVWTMTGSAHGVPIDGEMNASPARIAPVWAFAVAGELPDAALAGDGAAFRIVNLRTGASVLAPIGADGRYVAAFVDNARRSVAEESDTLRFDLLNASGYPLRSFERRVARGDLTRAFTTAFLSAAPPQARLLANYPNPFNPETWIPFELNRASDVTIRIYDAAGTRVRELNLGRREKGYHLSRGDAAYWDGRNALGEPVASGLYFYELQAEGYREIRRMAILK